MSFLYFQIWKIFHNGLFTGSFFVLLCSFFQKYVFVFKLVKSISIQNVWCRLSEAVSIYICRILSSNILDILLFIPLIQLTEEREFKTDPWLLLFFYSNINSSLLSVIWLTLMHQCHHVNVINVVNKVIQMLENHVFRATPCLPQKIYKEL